MFSPLYTDVYSKIVGESETLKKLLGYPRVEVKIAQVLYDRSGRFCSDRIIVENPSHKAVEGPIQMEFKIPEKNSFHYKHVSMATMKKESPPDRDGVKTVLLELDSMRIIFFGTLKNYWPNPEPA